MIEFKVKSTLKGSNITLNSTEKHRFDGFNIKKAWEELYKKLKLDRYLYDGTCNNGELNYYSYRLYDSSGAKALHKLTIEAWIIWHDGTGHKVIINYTEEK